MTTASSYARGTGYSRMGDRMTAISDQADVAPSLMPIPTGGMPRDDVGDDWEEQQRRWAGGRAPVATGPKSVEDFSEIEEAAAGVQADRCDCARAHAQAHTHTHTPQRILAEHGRAHGRPPPCVRAAVHAHLPGPATRRGQRVRVHGRQIHSRVHKHACVRPRYGYAGARSTRGGVPAPNSAGGNFPTGPAAVPHDGSRDSTSSAGSRASCRSLPFR